MPAIVALLAVIAVLAVLVRRQRLALRLLAEESRHDPLTGLANRRALPPHWARLAEPSLVLIDLIGFKAVNDHHGHIVGDALLRQVAARLQAAVPPPGLLVRWGGDEFAALAAADDVDSLLRRFDDALRPPFDLSAAGGPANSRISARTGVADGAPSLAAAEGAAARALLDAKGSEPSAEAG